MRINHFWMTAGAMALLGVVGCSDGTGVSGDGTMTGGAATGGRSGTTGGRELGGDDATGGRHDVGDTGGTEHDTGGQHVVGGGLPGTGGAPSATGGVLVGGELVGGEDDPGEALRCGGCVIEQECFPAGVTNPDNECEWCVPELAAEAWSPRPDGSRCTDGSFCNGLEMCLAGACSESTGEPCDDGVACNGVESCDEQNNVCVPAAATCDDGLMCDLAADECVVTCAGCVVAGVCYPDGAVNPANACESCDVATSDSGFTPVADGTPCSDGLFCDGVEACASGMCVGSTGDPCDDGVACNGAETCDEGMALCLPGTPTCDAGTACDMQSGECAVTCNGCYVGDVCYPDGAESPSSPCLVCDMGESATEWTPRADGTRCDDGVFCNGAETCEAGVCADSSGDPCDDGVSCNGVESCDEATAQCSPGASTCGAGKACDSAADACVDTCAGCLIGGTCFADGSENPANECEVCDASASPEAWTDRADGSACDDGLWCNGADACGAGACVSGAAAACDDGVACNGEETCNEASDSCSPGASTCGAGTACDTGADACVATCDGCLISGICYPAGAENPANECESCEPGTSQSAWTDDADGTVCDDGLWCNGTDACSAGSCAAGSAAACDDGVSCNGAEACNEASDSCSPGASPCGAGTYCDVVADACIATCNGCSIGGVCYPDGIENPLNPCEQCDTATSTATWTAAADDTVCGYHEVCSAGVCDCASGWVRTDGWCDSQGVTAVDDAWTGSVYQGIATFIPKVNLLANDVNNFGEQNELAIVQVHSASNCTATINGNRIDITASATGPASFKYVVQSGSDASTAAEATVTFTVSAAPSVIANADTATVQQGDSIFLTTSELLLNDVGTGLTLVSVGSPVGGTVSLASGTITFTSTDVAGQPAQFGYTIQDSLGTQASGLVYVTATPLAPVDGYVYTDVAAFNSKKTTFAPPTVQTVFNTWHRFLYTDTQWGSTTNYYWTDASQATGTAAAWVLLNNDISGDGVADPRFSVTQNGSFNGFISPTPVENYTHEVTLMSTDADDDLDGVVIAFEHSGGKNHVLYAGRSKGGYYPYQGWGLMEDDYGTILELDVDGTAGGWSGAASRVKVVRQGNLITMYCTPWFTSYYSPPAYAATSWIEVDLSSTTNNIRWKVGGVTQTMSRDLTRYMGPKSYGYNNSSQNASTFLDIDFDGGLAQDTLILLTDKDPVLDKWYGSEVWKYLSGAWTLTGGTIQTELGYVRNTTNPETSDTYTIRATEVELVP